MIKYIIFDCDGVLFDTERLSRKLWTELAITYGIELDSKYFDIITGADSSISEREFAARANGKANKADLKPIVVEKLIKTAKTKGITMKGVEELFSYLNDNNIEFGIASSSHLEYVKTMLSTLSKEYRIKYIITGDLVEHSKPDPEIFLKCAKHSGYEPYQCLVIEDSINGVIAANKAGMNCAFVEDTIPLNQEIEKNSTISLASLFDLIDILKHTKR